MRPLLDLLYRLRFLLLFILLETVCVILIYNHATLRDNVVFTSAGTVSGAVRNVCKSVSDYFGLKDENARLANEIAGLRAELYELRDSLAEAVIPSGNDTIVVARVIDNVVNRNENFITINKGASDGVAPGMGVCADNGVAGVVYKVSDNYAVVMSLLNSNSKISCRVRSHNVFGFVRWTGGDTRSVSMTDLPSRPDIRKGDTIETSGFSESFRQGLVIGYVSDIDNTEDGQPRIVVRLASDLVSLGYVYINKGFFPEELSSLTEY